MLTNLLYWRALQLSLYCVVRGFQSKSALMVTYYLGERHLAEMAGSAFALCALPLSFHCCHLPLQTSLFCGLLLFPYTAARLEAAIHVTCAFEKGVRIVLVDNNRSAPITCWQALHLYTAGGYIKAKQRCLTNYKLDNQIIEAATSTSLCVDQDHSSEPSLLTALHAGLRFS